MTRDRQSRVAPRGRSNRALFETSAIGQLALLALVALLVAGCARAAAPSATGSGTDQSGNPSTVPVPAPSSPTSGSSPSSAPPVASTGAPVPSNSAPPPSTAASAMPPVVIGGGAPCLSATDPGQLCGGASVAPTMPPGSSSPGSQLVVTRADNGTTIHLAVGERFLLDLGSDLDWTVSGIAPAIVARVAGVTVIRGAQGLYEAQASGTTTLTATGSPICPATGVCPQFRVSVTLTITVG